VHEHERAATPTGTIWIIVGSVLLFAAPINIVRSLVELYFFGFYEWLVPGSAIWLLVNGGELVILLTAGIIVLTIGLRRRAAYKAATAQVAQRVP
jgi:hypothetical protein